MVPLDRDPALTFRFAEDWFVPCFHLDGVADGRRVSVFAIDPRTGERLGRIATATAGGGGWVQLAEPIMVRADGGFAVPEERGA